VVQPPAGEAGTNGLGDKPLHTCINQAEIERAERYFFLKATAEVKKFAKSSDYKNCSTEKDGILIFNGRLLDSTDVKSLEKVTFDLHPFSFCKPIVEKNSPLAYSIMLEVHSKEAAHRSSLSTYRQSLEVAYILGGRALAQEIRTSCPFCKLHRARLVEVELGKIHESRLFIAPTFTYVQVDLFGPYLATCEHNHRSSVKVWGVVFKCPATGAVFVHAKPS
jgi:hypothetical protein